MTVYSAETIDMPENMVQIWTTEEELRRLIQDQKLDWNTEVILWEVPVQDDEDKKLYLYYLKIFSDFNIAIWAKQKE